MTTEETEVIKSISIGSLDIADNSDGTYTITYNVNLIGADTCYSRLLVVPAGLYDDLNPASNGKKLCDFVVEDGVSKTVAFPFDTGDYVIVLQCDFDGSFSDVWSFSTAFSAVSDTAVTELTDVSTAISPAIETILTTSTSETTVVEATSTVGTDFWYKDVREFSPKQTFLATAVSIVFIVFMVWFFGRRGGK